jgi:pentapeptide MXKDX repeat protein
MSRFERRLGQRSSSPKPGGVPVCKLPKKNNRMMLSGFIDVNEKTTKTEQNTMEQNTMEQNTMEQNTMQQNTMEQNTMQQNTMEQNTMEQNTMQQNTMQQQNTKSKIIEDITNEVPKYTDTKIKKIMTVNEELKNLIRKTPDKNVRLILGHEIRLNTIELNVDCLNDMKCEKIYEEQQMLEKDEKILVNSRKVEQIEILVKKTLLEIEKKKASLEMQDTEINNNIQNNTDEINNIKENLQKRDTDSKKNYELINEINNDIKKNINGNKEIFDNFNEEIRKRDEIINNLKNYNLKIKNILEKIMSKSKKTELANDLDELESINL